MAFMEVNIFSNALGMATTFNMIMPERTSEPPAVLYLLHGLSDDHSIWERRTRIELYAGEYNLAVVMPTTHRGFYTDMHGGLKYYTYISQELPEIVSTMFNVSTAREKTFIAGLSMGGYGAVKIGLNNPDKFSAAASMSGVLDVKGFRMPPNEYTAIFGDSVTPENDPIALAQTFASCPEKAPKLFVCCGTSDELLGTNRSFKAAAEKVGLDLKYIEDEGSHSWYYWDEHIRMILKWFFTEK